MPVFERAKLWDYVSHVIVGLDMVLVKDYYKVG
jgi:hypothetical protein